MTSADRPRLASSVLSIFLTRLAVLPPGLIQGVLLARLLEPVGLGLYSALLTDVTMVVTVASLGLTGGLSVLIGERPARLRGLLKLGLLWGAATLLVPGLLAATLALRFPAWPARLHRLPLQVALIVGAALFQYVRDILNSLLLGTQQFRAQNLQALIISLLQLLAVVVLILLHVLSPASAIAVQVGSNVLLCVLAGLALYQVAREIQPSLEATPDATLDRQLVRRAISIGWRNFLQGIATLLLLRVDVYLLQQLLPGTQGQKELGIYQAGVRVAELVLMVPGAINTVLFAKSAAREDLTVVTVASAKLSLYVGLLCLGGMALLGQPLLLLFYGPRFSGSFLPCLLVLLGCSAFCYATPLAGTLSGAGEYPRSMIVSQVAALVCNVGANLVLIPRHGALGAAAASALAYSLSAVIIAVAFARRFHVPALLLLSIESPMALVRRVRSP